MKTVSHWTHLEEYGIVILTGEACALTYRILCDLTAKGKATVERALSVEIRSEPWNSGSNDDPHLASILLTPEMLLPLGVFALLDAGCSEVWLTDRAAIGVEPTDTEDRIAATKRMYQPGRRLAYHGPYQDRNLHQMSGRVR